MHVIYKLTNNVLHGIVFAKQILFLEGEDMINVHRALEEFIDGRKVTVGWIKKRVVFAKGDVLTQGIIKGIVPASAVVPESVWHCVADCLSYEFTSFEKDTRADRIAFAMSAAGALLAASQRGDMYA